MAIPQASQPSNLQATTAPQRRWGKSNERQQAVKIQRILEATIADPETPASSVASCAAAWTRVQEAKRIIDGKPLPGQLRPDLQQAKASKAFGRAKPHSAISVLKPAQPKPHVPAASAVTAVPPQPASPAEPPASEASGT